jgi:hypothetical protein
MSEQPENDAVERLEPLAEPLEPPSEHGAPPQHSELWRAG